MGGYKPGRDPALDNPKAVYKVLNDRIHYQEGSRIPFDPEASAEALEASCRKNFTDLLLSTPPGVAHDLLTSLRATGYTKIVKNMVKMGHMDTPKDWPEEWKTVAEATA